MMQKEIRRFQARGDSGLYTIVERQTIIKQTYINSPSETALGTKSLALSDGRPVTSIDGRAFKIVATGEIITAI